MKTPKSIVGMAGHHFNGRKKMPAYVLDESGAFGGLPQNQPKSQRSMIGSARPNKMALIGAALRDLDWTVGSGNDLAREQDRQMTLADIDRRERVRMAGEQKKESALNRLNLSQEQRDRYHVTGKLPEVQGNKVINDQLVDLQTGHILGDYRDMMSGAEGVTYRDPVTGQAIAKNEKTYTPTDPNKLAIEQQRADAATSQAESSRIRANQPRNGIRINADGSVQIGGTPQQQLTGPSAAEEDYLKDTTKQLGYQSEFENIIGTVDEALPMVSSFTAGMGSVLKGVPGSSAVDLQSKVDTIQAYLSFDRLQRMRDESKTGGALGSVTEIELALLSATVASLETIQSPQQLREHLIKIRDHLETIDNYKRQMFLQKYQTGDQRSVLDPNATVQGNISKLSDDLPPGFNEVQ